MALKINVDIQKVDCAEMDEMWSYVGNKEKQRWLRKDAVFLKLRELLQPFGITRFFTDDWGAYEPHLQSEQQEVGKRNTQKIERKHLTLRTRIKRLARKTICFSKSDKMHDIVIGIFVNRYEFGVLI